jgi:Spy/CpxP family protein refolding chaperone
MKGKSNFKMGAPWIILGALFLLSSLPLAQAKEGSWERLKEQVEIMRDLNELKLSPERAKALLAIEKKYAQERKDTVDSLKKYQEDLKVALAGATQNQAKISDLVSTISATQDKLFASVKMERDEAMALMTPTQQAQFIIIIGNRYQEVMKKFGNKNPK